MYRIFWVIIIVLLASSTAHADELRPTWGVCSAAFANSDEPRATAAAIQIGMLGMVKWASIEDPAEKAAFEARMQAERRAALKLDTSGILAECYAQLQPVSKEKGR